MNVHGEYTRGTRTKKKKKENRNKVLKARNRKRGNEHQPY